MKDKDREAGRYSCNPGEAMEGALSTAQQQPQQQQQPKTPIMKEQKKALEDDNFDLGQKIKKASSLPRKHLKPHHSAFPSTYARCSYHRFFLSFHSLISLPVGLRSFSSRFPPLSRIS